VLSPTIDSPPTVSERKCRLVAIVPPASAGASFLPYPPGLKGTAYDKGGGPDWIEVMRHMATRLTWVDVGFQMDVFPSDAPASEISASAATADVFVAIGIKDVETAATLVDVLTTVPTGAALGCEGTSLDAQSRVVFQVRTTRPFFTHRSVSTFDRGAFQLTDERFGIARSR
jgi:hypothetical protein